MMMNRREYEKKQAQRRAIEKPRAQQRKISMDRLCSILNSADQFDLQKECEELIVDGNEYETAKNLLIEAFLTTQKIDHWVDLASRLSTPTLMERIVELMELLINVTYDVNVSGGLGKFFGLLTLAKNKPILINDFDVLSLLENCREDERPTTISFVTQLLVHGCVKSKVFKPPNPWTMAVIRALGKLCFEENTSDDMKEEFRRMCITLNVTEIFNNCKLGQKLRQKLACFRLEDFSSIWIKERMRDLKDAVEVISKKPGQSSADSLVNFVMQNLLSYTQRPVKHGSQLVAFRTVNLDVLRAMKGSDAFGADFTNACIVKSILTGPVKTRFSLEIVDTLTQFDILDIRRLDEGIVHTMDSGKNTSIVHFGIRLVQQYIFDWEKFLDNEKVLCRTINKLYTICTSDSTPPSNELLKLIWQLKKNKYPYFHEHQRHFEEKMHILLKAWIREYRSLDFDEDHCLTISNFMKNKQVFEFLQTDEQIRQFCFHGIQMCVKQYCYICKHKDSNATTSCNNCCHVTDAFTLLVALLTERKSDFTASLNLYQNIFDTQCCALLQHEKLGSGFNQWPYQRILGNLFSLISNNHTSKLVKREIALVLYDTLRTLRPSHVPIFTSAWVKMVSNEDLMKSLLITRADLYWSYYAQLLIDAFEFLATTFVWNKDIPKLVGHFFLEIMKVLRLLNASYPEFFQKLNSNDYGIPSNGVQMIYMVGSRGTE
ncbi:Hypothetical predicted protein [Cloeon dipterum]|uniref:Uncharacterized protein n=1 Tax=Cloeon dipterum TaxID=197152 RepID=A0A8S1BZG9_9INSE|nr:Hypothetical predicted protein [Cloeon dipterum]